jgi:hypothetical protein
LPSFEADAAESLASCGMTKSKALRAAELTAFRAEIFAARPHCSDMPDTFCIVYRLV